MRRRTEEMSSPPCGSRASGPSASSTDVESSLFLDLGDDVEDGLDEDLVTLGRRVLFHQPQSAQREEPPAPRWRRRQKPSGWEPVSPSPTTRAPSVSRPARLGTG